MLLTAYYGSMPGIEIPQHIKINACPQTLYTVSLKFADRHFNMCGDY